MRMLLVLLVSAMCALGATRAVANSGALDIQTKAKLQAIMQQHIASRLIDGAYLTIDKLTGRVRKLIPLSAHPKILQIGEYFVLCSDFRDNAGKSANVDFYVGHGETGYRVFQAIVDDRETLALFMNRKN